MLKKLTFAPFLAVLLAGCGSDLPKTYDINGAGIEIIAEAWTPRGEILMVRSKPCPWKFGAWAAFRMDQGRYDPICLLFSDGEVREVFSSGMSLPIEHEEFEWADDWGPNGPTKE